MTSLSKAKTLFEEANVRHARQPKQRLLKLQLLKDYLKNIIDVDEATASVEKSKEQWSEIDQKRSTLVESCMSRQTTPDSL